MTNRGRREPLEFNSVEPKGPVDLHQSLNQFVGKGAPLNAERPFRSYGVKRTPTK